MGDDGESSQGRIFYLWRHVAGVGGCSETWPKSTTRVSPMVRVYSFGLLQMEGWQSQETTTMNNLVTCPMYSFCELNLLVINIMAVIMAVVPSPQTVSRTDQ